MIRRLRVSKVARRDELEIWLYTARTFDEDQADKYQSLLDQAKIDIELEPLRPSSRPHPNLGEGIRSYRIELSAQRSSSGIKSSPHVLYYTIARHDELLLLRVLHDAMEPASYLQIDYETPPPEED